MPEETVYVIGHKNPDTDGVAASIAYAYFKNQVEETKKYKAVVPGKVNSETEFVLNKIKMQVPEHVTNVAGKKIILMDHNEMGQTVDGADKAEVMEIIDHHKIGGMQTASPIMFHAEPLGSTCTIVADFLFYHKIAIPDDVATLLLAGILSDTVIFKSPTTTEKDKKLAKKLAKQTYLDMNSFGMDIKRAKSSIKGLSPNQVIMSDWKEFAKGNTKYGIGQIEVIEYDEAKQRKAELVRELGNVMSASGEKIGILMVTNIIKEESLLYVTGDVASVGKAFKKPVKDSELILDKVMSRKKQVVPPLETVL